MIAKPWSKPWSQPWGTPVEATGPKLDPDAQLWVNLRIAAGESMSDTKKIAVSNFIIAEKASGRWAKMKRLYLPVSGLAAPNAICMKSLTSGTWLINPTHAIGYVKLGHFDMGTNLAALGITPASLGLGVIVKKAPTSFPDPYVNMNTSGMTNWDSIGLIFDHTGPNSGRLNNLSVLDKEGVISANVISPLIFSRARDGGGIKYHLEWNGFVAEGPVSTDPITAMGVAGFAFTDAELGCFWVSSGFTIAEDTAFTANLKTLWETYTGLTLPTNLALDPDAAQWINLREAAGDTLTNLQKLAVSDFVEAEKASGRWNTNHRRIYLPTSGNPVANAICLKSLTSGNFVGGFNHGSGFVQSDGSSGRFEVGTSFQAEGLTNASAYLWMLQLTVNTGTAGSIGLDNSGNSRNELRFTPTNAIFRWAGLANSVTAVTDRLGIISASRFGGRRRIFQRKDSGSVVLVNQIGGNSGTVSSDPIEALRTGLLGTNYNDAQVGAFGFGRGMNPTNNNQFTANLQVLWESLTALSIP